MNRNLDQLLRSARDAMAQRQSGIAHRQWQAVLSIAPEHPVALNGLGTLALAEERMTDAAALFLRAATRDPKATVLWLNHAMAARAIGDDEGEKTSLSRALELEPLSLIANVRLAENAERTGNLTEAGAKWRAVTAMTNSMAEIPPDALKAVEHGRAFVAAEAAAVSARIEKGLAPRRARLSSGERRRVDAAIDHMFGRRGIYLNQCSGLHVPFLPADEYFDPALFPWLPALEEATPVIRAEFLRSKEAGGAGFEPYVQLPAGVPRNIWTDLDGSTDWTTLHLWRHGKRDDLTCARFPQTAEILDGLPLGRLHGRMPTIFFSVLAPHAHIPPHTGVTNARAIIHLPLIVPPGCRFRVGGDIREWIEGQAIAFDDTIEHEAWNESSEPRVVLILDNWNPYLSSGECELISDFYAVGIPETMN